MAYGIDLGTTYSAIARISDTGRPDIVNNQQDASATLPSAIYFDEGGSVIVGATAKEAGLERPERLFQYFKRYIGRDNDPDAFRYEVDGQEYNPVELSAIVLKKIKEYAGQSGENVEDVVITVPAYFNLAQRQATIQAGQAAGLNVLATINEPTAAALSYCFDSMDREKTVLVYDLGGGTFDVTLLKISAKNDDGSVDAKVLATAGDAMLGGYDWDQRLAQHALQKYAEENGLDAAEIEDEARSMIIGSAEKLKQELSNRDTATLKTRASGEKIKITVSREEFEQATEDLLNKTVVLLDNVLAESASKHGVTEDSIDLVLEVGGSSRMAQVQNLLTSRFQDRVRFYEPDKAVALGAAIAADMLSRNMDIGKFNVEIAKLTALQEKAASGEVDIEQTRVNVSPDRQSVEVVDLATGETTKVDTSALTTEYQRKIENGENITAQQLISNVARPETAKAINIYDVAPSTFGVIVLRGGNPDDRFSDNLIKKDEPTPCEARRTYSLPYRASRVSLPVTESASMSDEDEAVFDKVTKDFSFPDSSTGMAVKAELLMDVSPDLPEGSEGEVTVSFDRYANLKVVLYIPGTGEQKELNVNFSPVSDETIEKMKKNVATIAFADDVD